MDGRISMQLRLRASPPVLPQAAVRRPRLEELLDRSTSLPVTLVCAGPGSGKTAAVSSWLANRTARGPVAWLCLDRTDNDLRTFWSDVLAALIVGGIALGPSLRDLVPASAFGATQGLRVRTGLAELSEPVLLVLDDVHLVTDAAVLESLDRLLDYPSSTLRLILITRTDPGLRLHRLRMNSTLADIRFAELAFTESESAEVLSRSGLALSGRQVHSLHLRTEGWPAGVRLAAMSLDPADVDAAIARFSGTDRPVAEYLVGEVLQSLSMPERDFMLRTSVVERINASLAAVLTNRADGEAVLERLAASNALVVALGGDRGWFGYHPLFRELLLHRLALEQPALAEEGHLRAAGWFAAHDEPITAIRHASTAQAWEEVGHLVLRVGVALVVSADAAALASALRPAAARAAMHPSWSTLVAAATCHFRDGDYDSMRQDLVDLLEFAAALDGDVRCAVDVFASLSMIAYWRARGSAAELIAASSAASQLLDDAPRRLVPAARQLRVIADNNLAVGLLWKGDLQDAGRRFVLAEAQAREFSLALTVLNAQTHLALLDALHGRMRRAQERVVAALEVIDRRGWNSEGQVLCAYLTGGLTHLAWHQLDPAATQIDRGLAESAGGLDLAARLALGIVSVSVNLARAEVHAVTAAARQLAAEREPVRDPSSLLWRMCLVAQARAYLAEGEPQAAIDYLDLDPEGSDIGYADAAERVTTATAELRLDRPDRALEMVQPLLHQPPEFLVQAVEGHVLAAVATERLRRGSPALELFGRAVELAQPEGLTEAFLVAGPSVAGLLARHQQVVGRHRVFTTQISAALAPEEATVPLQPNDFEHLTERELVVLRYLPTMLKAAEIASDLYVSVNTVKQHNKSIYRKLGAATRRDAVDRARALNLL